MYALLSRTAEMIALIIALAGGAILLIITVLNCISIAGRALLPLQIGIGPIRGIYDMTEIGMAAAVFACMPWAVLRDSHARVDLFATIIPEQIDRTLDLLFQIAMGAVALLITWRLFLGMQDKMAYGETTFIAQIPVWYGYAASMVGAVGFVLIAAFCILRSARRLAGIED